VVAQQTQGWKVVDGPTEHDWDHRISRDIRLEHPAFPAWAIVVDVALGVGIVRLTVERRDGDARPTRPISTRDLCRKLALTKLGAVVRQHASDNLRATLTARKRGGIHASPALADEFNRWAANLPGRPHKYDDAFYASFVAEYLAALDRGLTVPQFARDIGFSRSRVNDLLREAQRRELYTSSGRGKAGGQITERGERALDTKGGN